MQKLNELLHSAAHWIIEIFIFVLLAFFGSCLLVLAIKNYQYYQSDDWKYDAAYEVYQKLALNAGVEIPPLRVIENPTVNAWTNGDIIIMTTGMLHNLKNKDEIAAILSHEMGHDIAHHMAIGHLPDRYKVEPVIEMEAQADKLGIYLMLKSGYDVCKGREVFHMLQKQGGEFADPGDHPALSFRYNEYTLPQCQ